MANTEPKSPNHGRSRERSQLIEAIGAAVVGFQEESTQFDDVAARVLAIHRDDLPCMTALLFGGPVQVKELALATQRPRSAVIATLGRLHVAGYVRHRTELGRAVVELTDFAREWIERIWQPLRTQGEQLLGRYRLHDLAVMHDFMAHARTVQQRQRVRIEHWLSAPAADSRGRSKRGGLAPAALRRVEVFVEARLGTTLRIADLAERANLSPAHFARAFKATTGMTPRAFVEARRVARAKQLILAGRSLAAVAVDTGFGSQSQLTVSFRRRDGTSPARFRRSR